jgi:hypothetical protein
MRDEEEKPRDAREIKDRGLTQEDKKEERVQEQERNEAGDPWGKGERSWTWERGPRENE